LLFGIGLAVAGMTRPEKVAGFLDFTGAWDPSLGLVMAGAVAVHFVLHRLVRRRPSPIFDTRFHLPTRKDIDPKLVLGAALFGLGWGLGGFCPGPALVSASAGATSGLLFVGAMLGGMLLQHAHAAREAASAAKKEKDAKADAAAAASLGHGASI
jgi:hypothetical protein